VRAPTLDVALGEPPHPALGDQLERERREEHLARASGVEQRLL
jgi:hypothetical protein